MCTEGAELARILAEQHSRLERTRELADAPDLGVQYLARLRFERQLRSRPHGRASWPPPAPRYTCDVLAQFGHNANDASRCAVLGGD